MTSMIHRLNSRSSVRKTEDTCALHPCLMRIHRLLVASLVPLGLVLARGAPASAQSAGPQSTVPSSSINISGNYVGTWGATTLRQDGDHVAGTYAYSNGHIDGTLVGNTLRFTWTEDDGSGRGMFVVSDRGALVGTWGQGADDHNGGAWQLAPTSAIATGATGLDSSLMPHIVASALGLTPPASRAGTWTVGIRFPWDGESLPNGAAFGVGGVGVDIGMHVSDTWYLGGSADWEAVLSTAGDAESGPGEYNRFRAGGEARYYFHEGTAAANVNDAAWTPIPRHNYLGVRGGIETFDGGTTEGKFADVTLGTEMTTSVIGMGMYISAGLSLEPASLFDSTPSSSSSPTASTANVDLARDMTGSPGAAATPSTSGSTMSPYVTLGMSMLF